MGNILNDICAPEMEGWRDRGETRYGIGIKRGTYIGEHSLNDIGVLDG